MTQRPVDRVVQTVKLQKDDTGAGVPKRAGIFRVLRKANAVGVDLDVLTAKGLCVADQLRQIVPHGRLAAGELQKRRSAVRHEIGNGQLERVQGRLCVRFRAVCKAEAALNAYLNPAPAPSPETKPEVKPEAKPSVPETKPAGSKNENVITTPAKGEGTNVTSSEAKNIAKVSSGGVNTGIDTNTEVYLTTLAVAGIAYLVVKKKEKSEKE